MSAVALAEYMISLPDAQERILHDSRFQSPSIVTANVDAMKALRAYNRDPKRSRVLLQTVKEALWTKSRDPSIRPRQQDEARRCFEAIELFERHENALGIRGLRLSQPPEMAPAEIEGVIVSVRPDFLVSGPKDRLGAGMIRVAKAPDPDDCRRDETRIKRGDHRREMARYLIALMQMQLEQQGIGVVDPSIFFVADVRLGERITPGPDHTARINAVRGACSQIRRLWTGIEPRASILKK